MGAKQKNNLIVQQIKGKRKMKNTKIFYTALAALSVMLMIWITASWVDVLLHNDPYSGECIANWNAFLTLIKVMR